MAIAPEGLGISNGPVWIGSRGACGVALEAWVAAVVVFTCPDPQRQFVYPLNQHQATAMRDKFVELSRYEPPPKPKTPGERYAAMKAAREPKGVSLLFDHDTDGIHITDRRAMPELDPEAVGAISFKGAGFRGVRAVAFSADGFALFAKTLTEVLELHVEPPE